MNPVSVSNQITYAYFCTLSGLGHKAATKVHHYNGKHYSHTTYHLTSVR